MLFVHAVLKFVFNGAGFLYSFAGFPFLHHATVPCRMRHAPYKLVAAR